MIGKACAVRELIAPEISTEDYRELSGRAVLAVAHWRKCHPHGYSDLVNRGLLVKKANYAATMADETARELHEHGIPSTEALLRSHEKWIFRAPDFSFETA